MSAGRSRRNAACSRRLSAGESERDFVEKRYESRGHNTHNRYPFPSAGFEPAISARERPQNEA